MKTVDFLGHSFSRLIIGDNPFNGWSYIPNIVNREQFLKYYTEEHIIETLVEADALGYHGMLPLGDPFILRMIGHLKDRGVVMPMIFQTFPAMGLAMNLKLIAEVNAVGVYHQGTTTDFLFESGRIDELKDNLKIMRDSGLKVGIGTHRPDVIKLAEDEGWDVDFYACCLQNARRGREHVQSGFITRSKSKGDLVFYPEDRPVMLKLISEVPKPCIVFKLFAGGQMFSDKTEEEIPEIIKNAYREVFSAIKPGDIGTIGVYQERKNQLKQNAVLFNEVAAELAL